MLLEGLDLSPLYGDNPGDHVNNALSKPEAITPGDVLKSPVGEKLLVYHL